MRDTRPGILIRPATSADAAVISAVHCSDITLWKTWDIDGTERPARYGDLNSYQRWLNGGPWMDVDLCADHLRRLGQCGVSLVAELDGRVLAEAELHTADEPPPFGRNVNLSVLYVHRNHRRQGLGSALLQHALALAASKHCDNFIVAHAEATDFYAKHGLRAAARWARFRISAQTGKAQYTTEPLPDAPYELVRGFSLAIGRYQNVRHDWERTRPGATPDFAEWRHLKVERYWITTGRHRAALILEESPRAPRTAETFLFTQTGPAPELIAAIRDLAARSGFDHLYFFAPADFKHKDAAPTDYSQTPYVKKVS